MSVDPTCIGRHIPDSCFGLSLMTESEHKFDGDGQAPVSIPWGIGSPFQSVMSLGA
jgi:hypothetical protein